MVCLICGSSDSPEKCILCEKDLCSFCVVRCDPRVKNNCVSKAGEFIIWQCSGTLCPTCAEDALIFTCKGCQVKFCRTVIGTWAKQCPNCKDYICGDCYENHIKTCTDFYDKEIALDKLYKLIEGDKKK